MSCVYHALAYASHSFIQQIFIECMFVFEMLYCKNHAININLLHFSFSSSSEGHYSLIGSKKSTSAYIIQTRVLGWFIKDNNDLRSPRNEKEISKVFTVGVETSLIFSEWINLVLDPK